MRVLLRLALNLEYESCALSRCFRCSHHPVGFSKKDLLLGKATVEAQVAIQSFLCLLSWQGDRSMAETDTLLRWAAMPATQWPAVELSSERFLSHWYWAGHVQRPSFPSSKSHRRRLSLRRLLHHPSRLPRHRLVTYYPNKIIDLSFPSQDFWEKCL